MPRDDDRVELLQGTPDMLILKTLLFGPAHDFKYYRLTAAGRRRLVHQESKWEQLVSITSVMRPVAE